MQTAVEWLVTELRKADSIGETDKIIEKAKEMEKEQLNIARLDGINLANKGYGKKESNGNFNKFSLYEHKETITSCNTIQYTEEEINKLADQGWIDYKNKTDNLLSTTFKNGWKSGVKWCKEQSKTC